MWMKNSHDEYYNEGNTIAEIWENSSIATALVANANYGTKNAESYINQNDALMQLLLARFA